MYFLSDFLNEDWTDRPAGPRLYLGAFGKHPGWNDHFDLGLETESLVTAKRIIYEQGIRAEVEAQTWEKLSAADRVPEFDHWFFWLRPRECLVGYCWSSRDGKGRSLYPFVLCAHLIDIPVSWVWSTVVPELREAAKAIRTASTAGRVSSTVAEALDALRSRHPEAVARESAGFIGSVGVACLRQRILADRSMLYPVYNDLVERFGSFAPGVCSFKQGVQALRSQSLRLPALNGSVAETINAWAGFLQSELDPGIPLLAIMAAGCDWADYILGRPCDGDVFCMKAGSRRIPLVTELSRRPTPRVEPLVVQKLVQLENACLPQTSVFNGQLSLRNLHAATARLDDVRAPGKGLFRRLFGMAKPHRYSVFSGD